MSNLSEASSRSTSTKLFLRFLAAVIAFYAIILAYHFLIPRQVRATESPAFLERCRQICETYGLVPSGRVDDDARKFLEATGQQKLHGPLEGILNDQATVVESENHPLIHELAPEFSLLDHSRRRVELAHINPGRPKIIVFYYGYFCSHCVAQLFALNDDLKYIEESGGTVVAISADAPETTAQRYAQYGEFDFPLLSDPDNSVAGDYGVFSPATEDQDEDLKHGTFVVDGNGVVVWAETGDTPFTNNRSLVKLISALAVATESASPDVE